MRLSSYAKKLYICNTQTSYRYVENRITDMVLIDVLGKTA